MKNLFTVGSILIILISCNRNHSNKLNEKTIVLELDKLEAEYEKICKNAGKEVWEYYSDTSKNSINNYKELFSELLLKDSLIKKINYLYSKSNEISNDTLVRRLKL